MNEIDRQEGAVIRVNGPIIHAEGMGHVGAFEVVKVGADGLIGEVLKLAGDVATIQVYEYTGGLKPGDVVKATGSALAVTLAPGLLGNIFDGLQRPLRVLAERDDAFLQVGAQAEPLDPDRLWRFEPTVKPGEELHEGQPFAVVKESPIIDHRLMAPPGMSGTVSEIKPAGEYTISQTLCALDTPQGKRQLTMVQRWPVRRPRPKAGRKTSNEVLVTGQRVIDTLFPVSKGGVACLPGDFGTGKTVLQQQLAKWSDADIIVYVGCGERGNEMADVLRTFPELEDPRTGRALMERTILVANTSNMPVAAREVSIYTGITLAEYYRDMGYAVALMADSTSRWAEALREASSRLEEMPAEQGYPAYLSARLAQFYERAGLVRTLGGAEGSLSVIGAVSPPGGDFSEPVTQHTMRFTRCLWALERSLAHARHYPAVSWTDSYSQYLSDVAPWWESHDPDWLSQRGEIVDLLSEERNLQEIVKLVGPDVLPDAQRLTLLVADLFKTGFLQQDATDPVDTFCVPGKQVKLLRAFVMFYRRASAIIQRGAPISRVREMDVTQRLRRAKMLEEKELDNLLAELEARMDKLEQQYT
ncbi:MAG: V-type ATP synthase subunit A [Planctomycetes bacterium]|nr:V-type ATP synthase subunit A [Planctomycetota bacterium]